tara:strand:+ start:1147 stop:1338 length:192 start_codon:yes stop_codon:yes gene_type:complete
MKHQRKNKERKKVRNRNFYAKELEDRKYHQRVVRKKKQELQDTLEKEEMQEYLIGDDDNEYSN